MSKLRLFTCAVLLLLVSVRSSGQTNITGTWSGDYAFTDHCDNGATFTSRGTATAGFNQSGSAVTGSIVANNVTFTDGSTCTPKSTPQTFTLPVTGTISGGTFSGTFVAPEGGRSIPLTGAVTATSMSLSFPGQPTTSGTFTLSLISSQPPDSALTGTYMGRYTSTFVPCGTLPAVTYSGDMTITLVQTGNAISGTVTVFGNKKDQRDPTTGVCTVVDNPPNPFALSGQVNGSTLTLTVMDKRPFTFTAMVSGNTISATVPPEFPGEAFSFSVTRTSSGPPPPPPPASIGSFTAAPSTIVAGGSTTLSWSTTNATSVTIDNGVGSQPSSGSVSVSPRVSTTYTLTAAGLGGSATATTTVTVTGSGPRVVAATLPSGMLQPSGESGATDSFSIANIGTNPANVTLSKSGSFFSIAPSSFTLQPGASQSITITASTQPPATYDGSITVNGDGVVTGGITLPVHLLVAAAPSGTVRPQPATARVDVAAPVGQNPSGFVAFTNTGSAAMIGIAVSDVPWIVPQSGTITISPGETKNITFSIDRSLRPDASSLFGGATGSISLRFLGSATAANAVILGTTPTSTVTVTIVDVVQPGLTAGAPPPLGSGELALFVAGHGSLQGIASDLLLANRSSSPLTNLRLFLSQSSQFASLPQLAANLGVTLPSVSTSIFGVDAGGSLMLRGSVDSLATAALRTVTNGSAAYTSAIPVFRSDQGVGPGGRIVLSGVDRSATARTIVVLQELSGNSGSVELQGYDVNGAPLGARVPIALSAFYSVTDDGLAVVDGTRSIVITNTGSGSSRINAYARVSSISTADSWIIVDPSLVSGSDTMIMPMVPTPAIPAQTDIYVTNVSNSAVSATLNIVSASTKRRSIRTHAVGDAESTESQQLSIRPLETKRTTLTPSSGYIRLTGTPGSISASARVTMTSGATSFGSALPVLAASSASSNGQLKRFSGVGDSSARTIAAGTSATFRSSLILIETAGQSTTVRVSVWYSLPAGILVTAQAVSSKEFTVGANQMIVISDLARSIIGAQRDSFGDLRDMQVDVEVTGSSGRVLSYIQSIDNGSGDVVIRTE